MPEPLRVDPAELHLTAGRLDGHAGDFLSTQQGLHSRAGQVSVGSGAARAALTQMLGAWEETDTHFVRRVTTHAEGHREAATRYVGTDTGGADGINAAGSAL